MQNRCECLATAGQRSLIPEDQSQRRFCREGFSPNQTVQVDLESPEPEMNAPLQMVIPLAFDNSLGVIR